MILIIPKHRLSELDQRIVNSWNCDEVVVKPYKEERDRTLKQNAYLWSVVYAYIADFTGYSTEEVHEACKYKFLPRTEVSMGESSMSVPKSTKMLTTKGFTEYLDRVIAFAASELSISIPPPE